MDRFVSNINSVSFFNIESDKKREEGPFFDFFNANFYNGLLNNKSILQYRQNSTPFNGEFVFVPKKIKKVQRFNTKTLVILDAPFVYDDFYVNILDWYSNLLSVCLDKDIYFYDINTTRKWNVKSTDSTKTSVLFSLEGKDVVYGDKEGSISKSSLISEKIESLTTLNDDYLVSSCWDNETCIYIGTKHGSMLSIDFRQKRKNHILRSNIPCSVCKLKKSPFNENLIASGFNDNSIKIWDRRNLQEPFLVIDDHTSAVKALSWKRD